MILNMQSDSIVGSELFRKVYKKEISDDLFYHKHFNNPERLSIPCIIAKDEDKAIGMHWMMKQKFVCENEELISVQGSDDAILPEARGKSVFRWLRMRALDSMKEDNVDFEFGCFAKGNALEIAEHFGEKEIVDLYLARFFLKEKHHKWKRFNIRVPEVISDYLFRKRREKVRLLSDESLEIDVSNDCPFREEDYVMINNNDSLHAIRSNRFYEWKFGKKNKNSIKFITARNRGNLVGFLIVDFSDMIPKVADWDIICDSNKESVLASLFYLCMKKEYEYIDIPYLNSNTGEMKSFEQIGATDMSKLWAPACICVKPINEKCRDLVTNPFLWKLRLIDADYYLNT